jgi:hypothetical protein
MPSTTGSTSLAFLLTVLIASVLSGCGGRTPQTKPAEVAPGSDEVQQRINEQAETRKRNLSQSPLTRDELNSLATDPMHKAHLQLWQDQHSFYALMEIAEGIIEPELGRIKRQDIQKLLGEGSPDYPNSNGHILEYVGNRHIPRGAHLLIYFDENDIAQKTDWVSE